MTTEDYTGTYFMTMLTGYAYASIRQLKNRTDTYSTTGPNRTPQEPGVVWGLRAACMSTVIAIAGVAIAVNVPPCVKIMLPATLAAGALVEITAMAI